MFGVIKEYQSRIDCIRFRYKINRHAHDMYCLVRLHVSDLWHDQFDHMQNIALKPIKQIF